MLLFYLIDDIVFRQNLACVELGDNLMQAQKLDRTKYWTKPADALRNSLHIGSKMGWRALLFPYLKRLTWWREG